MLIKSVSGARVIVCFQDPPCVSLCVIGCYQCCEYMLGVKEQMDRLQCDCSSKSAFKSMLFCPILYAFRTGIIFNTVSHVIV